MDFKEQEECVSFDSDENGYDIPNTITCLNTVHHGLSNVHSIHYICSKIIIANSDTIKIWDLNYGAKSLSTYPLRFSKSVMKMTPTETGYLIMPCGWQSILVCYIITGQLREHGTTVHQPSDQIVASCTDIVTKNDVNTFVTSWDNGFISFWDLRSPAQVQSKQLTDEAIVGMDLHGHCLWTASRDKCIRCLDLRMEKDVVYQRKFEHNLRSVSYSPSQGLLAIGMDFGNVVVCNPANLSGSVAHFGTGEITYLKHSHSGEWFVAAHERKLIISDSFYPIQSVVFQKLMPDSLNVLAISPDDKYITTINRTPYSATYELRC